MRRILVPIDPAEPARTRSAVDEVVRIYRDEPVAIRLLRVQPKVSNHVAMFFEPDELRRLLLSAGAEDLEDARRLLDAAGVPYTTDVQVGRSAQTIVTAAREYGCDRIIFGREQRGITGRLFGSLAQQVQRALGTNRDLQVIGS